MALEQVCDGQISSLSNFTQSPPGAGDYTRIYTAVCPDCDESSFVSVHAVETTTDKDGNDKISSRLLVENMVVKNDDTLRMINILESLPMTHQPATGALAGV